MALGLLEDTFGFLRTPLFFRGYRLYFLDVIETFLDARANDSDSFTFTPPGESSSSEFVCDAWSKSIPYLNRATIQATFREVFEP